MAWINELAQEFKSRDNKKTLGAVCGSIISITPIKVELFSGAVILSNDKLYVCESLVDHNLDCDVKLNSIADHGAVNTTATITIKSKLKIGDKVLCVPADGGQKFFIVDKVV